MKPGGYASAPGSHRSRHRPHHGGSNRGRLLHQREARAATGRGRGG